jgi:exodeoxyribonuclease VII small subunit
MAKKKQSFEQALRDLETVVAKMESGDLPLDDCLAYYERGVKLCAFCAHELDLARQRIELLHKTADGALRTVPFASEDTDAAQDDANAEADAPGTLDDHIG